MSSLPDVDVVDARVGVITGGQGPVVIGPRDNLGPTKTLLSVPPAVIVYIVSQASPSIVTVAIPLATEAVPKHM